MTNLNPRELSFLYILAFNSVDEDNDKLELQMDAIDSLLNLNGLGPYSDVVIDEDAYPLNSRISPEDYFYVFNRVTAPNSPLPFFITWWLNNDKPLSAEELATLIKIIL